MFRPPPPAVRLGVSIVLLFISLSGCSSDFIDFETGTESVRARITLESLDDGRRIEVRLPEPISPEGEVTAIRVDIAGQPGEITVSAGLWSRKSPELAPLVSIEDPLDAGVARYLIPVVGIEPFDVLRIDLSNPAGPGVEGETELPVVTGVGFAPRSYGIDLGEVPSIDTDIAFRLDADSPRTEYRVDIGRLRAGYLVGESSVIEVAYRYDRGGAKGGSIDEEPVSLVLSTAAGDRAGYRVTPHGSSGTLRIYDAAVGFATENLEIRANDPGFALTGFRFAPVDREAPLEADFGTILAYPEEDWRRTDFELFRWSTFPSILVFDTESYAVQAVLFRRLAFFVEKRGYVGRILTDQELAWRHGWNAHDYRAEDLASFFDLADPGILNDAEHELLEILIEDGIVVRTADGFAGGVGGIISISRESSPGLRSLFLRHEGYHGYFFADSRFRERVLALWNRMEEEERRFWRHFLDNRGYNPDDDYLMANEFQAYLLQQPISQVDPYFRDFAALRYVNPDSDEAGFISAALETLPDLFTRPAQTLLDIAEELSGIRSGDLRVLVPE